MSPIGDKKELAQDQLVQERTLEERVAELRIQPGLDNPESLEVVFELLGVWIALYRLNKTDQLLQEVLPFCEKLGGAWHIKGIQMLGFCRWKQYRYSDALELFHKMEEMVGPSAALYENIGHTYSTMGNLDNAEKYFKDALELSAKHTEGEGNTGGILLGLGLIKDRQNKVAESLPVLQQALQWYQERSDGTDASLVAKAHMSVGKAHQKLDTPAEAEYHFREALRIFIVTCGDDSPLSAGAMASLGKLLLCTERPDEAQVHLKGAIAREATKDAIHIHTVFELLTTIMGLHLQYPTESGRGAFEQYVPIIRDAAETMKLQGQPEDGNYGAFCKTAGEFCALAGSYKEAEKYFTKAIELFRGVTELDCTQLVQTCEKLLASVRVDDGIITDDCS